MSQSCAVSTIIGKQQRFGWLWKATESHVWRSLPPIEPWLLATKTAPRSKFRWLVSERSVGARHYRTHTILSKSISTVAHNLSANKTRLTNLLLSGTRPTLRRFIGRSPNEPPQRREGHRRRPCSPEICNSTERYMIQSHTEAAVAMKWRRPQVRELKTVLQRHITHSLKISLVFWEKFVATVFSVQKFDQKFVHEKLDKKEYCLYRWYPTI